MGVRMRRAQTMRAGAALIGIGIMLAAAAPVGVPMPAAMARIEPGRWQIKTVGDDTPGRAVCISDPTVLIHYQHHNAGCEHRVTVDQPDLATVQYRCAGSGSGRTTFHVATPRAFNLDVQGLDGGLPYDESYEAHRLGNCGIAR